MKQWENYGIKIDRSKEDIQYTSCPKCQSRRKNKEFATLAINPKMGHWFCRHCGFSGNLMGGEMAGRKSRGQATEYNPSFSHLEGNALGPSILDHFRLHGITLQTLQKFNIVQNKVWIPEMETDVKAVVYPYNKDQQIASMIYITSGNKRFAELGGAEICYGYDDIKDDETIIVADELEKLTFWEAGINNVIAPFGGPEKTDPRTKARGNRLDFLANIEEKLKPVKKFVLAMPNNDTGQWLTEELVRRLGKERCWTVHPPTEGATWNQVYCEHGQKKLQWLMEAAKPCPVQGLFNIDDVEDAFDNLWLNGLKRGTSTGLPTLDDYYTVVPGQWTVITGIPSHGKSNFLDAIMVNLAENQGWRFGIFSPENQPIERHFASLIEKYYGATFSSTSGNSNRITEEQKNEGKTWLRKHFNIVLPNEDGNWTIDGILHLAKALVYQKGINGLVIDPWNELDHSRPPGLTETEYVSLVLSKIRQFARNFGVHVWLVAHPAKLYKDKDGKYPVPTPYDISGSAHFRNKADCALTVWRNVGGKDSDVADVHVQKIRFKEVGRPGLVSLRYQIQSGRFIDDLDQDKRKRALENGDELPSLEFKRK